MVFSSTLMLCTCDNSNDTLLSFEVVLQQYDLEVVLITDMCRLTDICKQKVIVTVTDLRLLV